MHGYEIDSEHIEEDVERPINPVDENKYVCLIDTDEECEWEFFPVTKDDVSQPFLINITAEDTPQQGVSSEFEDWCWQIFRVLKVLNQITQELSQFRREFPSLKNGFCGMINLSIP